MQEAQWCSLAAGAAWCINTIVACSKPRVDGLHARRVIHMGDNADVAARFGAGVPCKQYKLIHKDGLRISTYVARTFDGVARTSHLRKDNYFYYNCCTGARQAPLLRAPQ